MLCILACCFTSNVMAEFASQQAADRCVLENREVFIEGQRVTMDKALTQLQQYQCPDAAEEKKKRER